MAVGRAGPHAKPSTAHRQGEGRSRFQQVGWVGRRLPDQGGRAAPSQERTTWGHWAQGCPGARQSWGGCGAGQQVRTLGGREAALAAALGGAGSGLGGVQKVADFLQEGVSVSQSPYPGGPGPSPLLPLQQAAPLLASWKSGKVTAEPAPSQVPQEEEVTHPWERRGTRGGRRLG